MILLAHMLLGAAIGAKINNIPLAIILAFLGHYFLDILPHVEYSIDNIRNKKWQKSFKDILKVFLDFCLALLVIFIFSKNQLIIYLCALISIMPDGLTIINSIFPRSKNGSLGGFIATLNKILAKHDEIHTKKIHFLKYKKISNFWRISTQVLTIIICIILLR